MNKQLTLLLAITIFLLSITTPVFADEIYLKCDGTRFGDELWSNITFVKIYPEKGQAFLQDQFDDRHTGWLVLKIIRFEKEFIQLTQCAGQDCSASANNHYMIDRVTGRMRSGSYVNDENGNEKFFGLAYWSCSKVRSSF